MESCIFCTIAKKEAPAQIVFEDEKTVAFLDINPTNKGHTLVIPRTHAANIYDMSLESLTEVMETVHRLAPAIKHAVGADGMNIIMNNEPAAGQLVSHAHVHVVPRFAGDGYRHWRGAPYQLGEIETVAESIRLPIT